MSGIFGLLHLDGRPVEEDTLNQMASSLSHRGPDGAKTWVGNSIGLGHRMLRTTPESVEESLPLIHPEAGLILTADARIDNRVYLVNTLGLDNFDRLIPDSELILASFLKWGETCVERLIGDFAFAIWDDRNRRLFCARDRVGARTFYFFQSDRNFVFGSEIRSLLRVPEVPRRLNESRVAHHIARSFDYGAETFYEGIYRLPVATSMTVTREKTTQRTYWSLDPSRELKLKSDEDHVESFREIFTEAVRCRIRRIGPIGVTLSGGLDSSAIACVTRDLLAGDGDQAIHTFSAVFPSLPPNELKAADERPFINAVHETGGFLPHFILADRLGPLKDIGDEFIRGDEPHFAYQLYYLVVALKIVKSLGIRVVLNGYDGDSVVSYGWQILSDLLKRGRFLELLKQSRKIGNTNQIPTRWLISNAAIKPLIPDRVMRSVKIFRGRQRPSILDETMMNPTFARKFPFLEKKDEGLSSSWFPSSREIHGSALSIPIIPAAVEFTATAGSLLGLDTHSPFLDTRLMEFCLSIPTNQKIPEGWSRGILRKAMDGILPPMIQSRVKKANMAANFRNNLASIDGPALKDILIRNGSILGEFYQIDKLSASVNALLEPGREGRQFSEILFGAAVLGDWLSGNRTSFLSGKI